MKTEDSNRHFGTWIVGGFLILLLAYLAACLLPVSVPKVKIEMNAKTQVPAAP